MITGTEAEYQSDAGSTKDLTLMGELWSVFCEFLWGTALYLVQMSLKFVPNGPIDNYVSIVLGKGLVPNRRQAITWTSDGTDSCHMALLGHI